MSYVNSDCTFLGSYCFEINNYANVQNQTNGKEMEVEIEGMKIEEVRPNTLEQ